jgi:hypothetical protein
MNETPFPQYRKGVPKAGLDEITHFIAALGVAGLPFFLVQMALGDWFLAPVAAAAASWGTFKLIAVPVIRYVFHRLPPLYIEHYVQTVFLRGGLAAQPDPDPIPFKVD